MTINFLYAAVLGYLCGSVPFGLLLTRAAGLGDIRAIGSGNIGATNVLRTGNRWLAAATLILDAAKAALPVLFARYFWGEQAAMIAGHLSPSSAIASRSGSISRAARASPSSSARCWRCPGQSG